MNAEAIQVGIDLEDVTVNGFESQILSANLFQVSSSSLASHWAFSSVMILVGLHKIPIFV
jgi:hypothetical protein